MTLTHSRRLTHSLTRSLTEITGLTGTIPPALGDLSQLRVLLLGTNSLSGSVPPELAKLSQLNTLWPEGNALSGIAQHSVAEQSIT